MSEKPRAYALAHARWLDDAERRRKSAKLPPGKVAPGTPAPPLSPDGLRWLLFDGPFYVGESRALDVLQVNRTTLGRWLSGVSVVPRAAALVLRQLAEGIPPGGSDHWHGFRFEGDALVTPAGERYAARRIESLPLVFAQVAALQREISRLHGVIDGLRRVGGSANDATAMPPPARVSADV